MSVAAGVSGTAITVREKLRGKIGQTKVKRYWPRKAPAWAEKVEEDAEIEVSRSIESLRVDREKAFPLMGELDFPAKDDPRLRRLAENRRDRDEAVARHRQIRQAEIVSTREEDKRAVETAAVEEEDDDATEQRRQRIKEKLLQRQREDEVGMEEEEEEEEEEESEYETDSEEEFGGLRMLKPVFVPKAERETVAARDKLEADEKALKESLKKKLEDRKVETKHLVVQVIKQEVEREKNREAEGYGGDIDTGDETNAAEEYEAWKVREIARIKRDRENKETIIKEKEDIDMLRSMSEEERKDWERKNPKPSVTPKTKWKFMQKYYHKGAFFQSGADDNSSVQTPDDIFKRDFSVPTGKDKMNKTKTRKIMQVKNWGRSGRTKWTHLVEEDTTKWDDPWTYKNNPLRAKYDMKMGGMDKPISKPQGSRKLKDWEQI